MSETEPLQILFQLGRGYWASRCLHVVAELGVADHLDETPQTAEALAKAIDVHPQALSRVLRALASVGIFEEVDDRFGHSPASRLLRTDHPKSRRALARMMGMPIHWAAFGQIEHALRTGEPAVKRVAHGGSFEYFASHPAEARIFDEAMTAKAHEQVESVLGAYDFSGFQVIADIGGGRGHLIRAVLAATPSARGVLFDLPRVIEGVDSQASGRLALQAGNFFEDRLPACDAYLLMNVVHDWGDAEATALLEAVRRAALPHSKLLLLELPVPEGPGFHPTKLTDIEMLVMTSGRERTLAEYERLLSGAGLRLDKVIPTERSVAILEARAA